jgi:ATP-dependent DNA ligase
MSNSTIPLAKKFEPSKITFPAFLSQKHDGVPVKIIVNRKFGSSLCISAVTRQNKPVPSIDNYLRLLAASLEQKNILCDGKTYTFVAEVTHETLINFKDVSGVVRKQSPQNNLIFNVFDFDTGEGEMFKDRIKQLKQIIMLLPDWFKMCPQEMVFDQDDLAEHIARMLNHNPLWEGLILRSGEAKFKPGTRHWDYQKIVIDPTIDLRIVRLDEAIDKDGKPKGMVGALIAEYNGKEIGIGPGKLTHKERYDLWRDYMRARPMRDFPNKIATIKYKRDPSYDALRQPTFQHWRPEKLEESYD